MNEELPALLHDQGFLLKMDKLYERSFWTSMLPIVLALACFLCAGGLITYKVLVRGYRMVNVDREESWKVKLLIDVEAANQNLTVRAMSPEPLSARQRVFDFNIFGDGFRFTQEGPYTVWRHPGLNGKCRLVMKYRAQTEEKTYSLPSFLGWDDMETEGLEVFLKHEDLIQCHHTDIRAQAELLASESEDVMDFVRMLYLYVRDSILYQRVGGPTDAVTAYRLGEASCNGKNRLLVALARAEGIPARLVKGLILEKGVTKKQSHAWSEIYIHGQWIPFCPTSDYYARIPARYLEYAKMDARMFKYTKNVNFERRFEINRGVRNPEEAFVENLDNPRHILKAWGSLGNAEFSLSLLMVILTIPVGATIVALLRNVVGLVPFGTFLPALIAVAFRETGLFWGLGLFSLTILLGVGLNELLRRLHLLHFPRLAIIMTFIVACILGLALLAMNLGYPDAAKVGMFPIAILTLTVERFTLAEEQDGFQAALNRMLISLVAATFCYVAMMNFTIRSAFLVFPELLLVCVGINLIVGLYTGLRLTELIRFRHLRSTSSTP